MDLVHEALQRVQTAVNVANGVDHRDSGEASFNAIEDSAYQNKSELAAILPAL
jgi:hypothetical protein